jgi:hypothetical protein
MNAKNALGFLVVGIVMKSLPGLSPDWFPPTGCDGTSASAIWLTTMGRIEILLGSWYLVKNRGSLGLRRLAVRRAAPPDRARVSLADAQTHGLGSGL